MYNKEERSFKQSYFFGFQRPSEIHPKEPTERYPIHVAIEKKLPNIDEILLANEHLINTFNEKGYTPLHLAVIKNQPDIISLLLKCDDLDINEKVDKNHGQSALHIAVLNQNVEITKQLLGDERIDVRLICGYTTAFHDAATNIAGHPYDESNTNQILIMKMLLAHEDNDVNRTKSNGHSPLHEVMNIIPARSGNEAHTNRVFNLLLSAKDIKVNTCTDKMFGNNTHLHQAAEMGNLNFVEALLAHEDIEIKKNLKGNTPKDLAGKYPLVIDAFERYLKNPVDFKTQYKIKQSHNEIRKNARVLTQGKKSGCFFESNLTDLLHKIAAFTGDQRVHSEEETLKISCTFMDSKI